MIAAYGHALEIRRIHDGLYLVILALRNIIYMVSKLSNNIVYSV